MNVANQGPDWMKVRPEEALDFETTANSSPRKLRA